MYKIILLAVISLIFVSCSGGDSDYKFSKPIPKKRGGVPKEGNKPQDTDENENPDLIWV